MTSREGRSGRNAAIIEEFRSNGGSVASRPGLSLVLLTSKGAKTGLQRTNPVAYLRGDDCLYIFATKGGSPTHPDWYHNLVANPTVTVEVGTETYEAIAEPVTGQEHDRIYAMQAELHPVFAEYQEKTTRVIPVVALRRKRT